jgi:pimeloyl-ACP methyl ester carboxylesterase
VDGFVENGRVKLAIRDHGGTGPSVLLIHGAGRTLADWGLIAPLLLGDHHVVAMDVRGHGHSDDGEWGWEAVLDDTRAVVSAFSLDPVTVVGHSLGGMIAAMYGERLAGISAAVNLDGHGKARPDQYVGVSPDELVERLTMMSEVGKQLLSAPPISLPAEHLEAARAATLQRQEAAGLGRIGAEPFDRSIAQGPDGEFRTRPNPEFTRSLIADVEELDLFAVYRRVACPLLVYQAIAAAPAPPGLPSWWEEMMAAHRLGLARDLEALAEAFPHVQVHAVDATHALILEQPELIAAELIAFIAAAAR